MASETWRGVIETLSHDGLGVGTQTAIADGKEVRRPVFIPFAVPGDEIEAAIVEQKGKYLFGELSRIITPSPHRVAPPCPHFGLCGGCDLEHLAYEEQLHQKAAIVEFLLRRKGVRFQGLIEVLPSKSPHNYRWRSRIAIRIASGKVVAGFRKRRSHEIVPVNACFIVAPQILEFIRILNATPYIGGDEEFEVVAVLGSNGKLGLQVPLDDIREKKAVKLFFDTLFGVQRKMFANLFFEEKSRLKIAGQVQEHFTYKAAGFEFSFLPETFIQGNIATNDILIMTVIDCAVKEHGSGALLDLYGGIGNLSLPLSKRFEYVISVEGDKRASQLCAINAAKNNAANIVAISLSVEQYLREYVKRMRKGKEDRTYRRADVIVLDPPRTGCTEQVVEALLRSEARLVYVSCDPATLARDLALLQKKYRVDKIICVDMFPDTTHVETVVTLEKI